MDKEAQEKIAETLKHYRWGIERANQSHNAITMLKIKAQTTIEAIDQILALIPYIPKGKPPLVGNPYTTEYKYQCSMDAGMPQNLIVNDDGYVGFEEGKQAQREADIKWYEGAK